MVVTITSTMPTTSAGDVTVIELVPSAAMVPAVDPKATSVAPARFVPMMVTAVPPALGPDLGLTEVIDGNGTAVP